MVCITISKRIKMVFSALAASKKSERSHLKSCRALRGLTNRLQLYLFHSLATCCRMMTEWWLVSICMHQFHDGLILLNVSSNVGVFIHLCVLINFVWHFNDGGMCTSFQMLRIWHDYILFIVLLLLHCRQASSGPFISPCHHHRNRPGWSLQFVFVDVVTQFESTFVKLSSVFVYQCF